MKGNTFDIDWGVMKDVAHDPRAPLSRTTKPDGSLQRLRQVIDPKLQGRDRTRELVRARDGWTCQNCGKQWKPGMRRFDIHHIYECGVKSTAYDRVEDMDGLITYCHRCHMTLDNRRWQTGRR